MLQWLQAAATAPAALVAAAAAVACFGAASSGGGSGGGGGAAAPHAWDKIVASRGTRTAESRRCSSILSRSLGPRGQRCTLANCGDGLRPSDFRVNVSGFGINAVSFWMNG